MFAVNTGRCMFFFPQSLSFDAKTSVKKVSRERRFLFQMIKIPKLLELKHPVGEFWRKLNETLSQWEIYHQFVT